MDSGFSKFGGGGAFFGQRQAMAVNFPAKIAKKFRNFAQPPVFY
jgi:hypothetical protein